MAVSWVMEEVAVSTAMCMQHIWSLIATGVHAPHFGAFSCISTVTKRNVHVYIKLALILVKVYA